MKDKLRQCFVSFSRRKGRIVDFLPLLLLLLIIIFFSYSEKGMDPSEPEKKEFSLYSIIPVDIQNVVLSNDFRLSIIDRRQDATINYALEKSDEEGRFDNLLVVGGKMQGEIQLQLNFSFSDSFLNSFKPQLLDGINQITYVKVQNEFKAIT